MQSQSTATAAAPAKTEVCITVDVEFSIGGAFANPDRYRPISTESVNCVVDGREEGLGFLLRTLREHDAKATFFLEVLQTFYYGEGRMAAVAERIAKEGHDIQMHLHPCWLHFRQRRWRDLLEDVNDSCADRDEDELASVIRFGLEVFERWGLPRPIALRTGGFRCDRTVYSAMRKCGLTLASNVALGVYHPSEPELQVTSGRHLVDGIMELPVLGYSSALPLLKPMIRSSAITAVSWNEMETLLWSARENLITPFVVLTHPFEFVKQYDFRYSVMRRNRVNQERLERLLHFINHNVRSFATATFGQDGQRWLADGPAPSKLLNAARGLSMVRAAQNFLNDRI
jgi:hypothetical protein